MILGGSSNPARPAPSFGTASRHYLHLGLKNAIRPTALGKKNWLFFGSEEAGQRSAVIYTLIENCRLQGVEPYTYLKDVLERLPSTTNQEVAQLAPLQWQRARAHQSAARQAAGKSFASRPARHPISA